MNDRFQNKIFYKKNRIEQNKIYKYCSYETIKKILISQKLRFTNPLNFNDPFDSDIEIIEFDAANMCDEVKDEVKMAFALAKAPEAFIKKVSNAKIEEMYRGALIDKINRSSVCCFSLSSNNTLMWSHYAENHKGVCLEFDLEIGDIEILHEDKVGILGKVDYDRKEKINYLKDKDEALFKLFCSKNKDWEYEKEARIVLLDKIGDIKFKKNCITGMIYGLRLREENKRNELKELCKQHEYDIKFKEITKRNFDITVIEL